MDVANDAPGLEQNVQKLKYQLKMEDFTRQGTISKIKKYKVMSMEISEKIEDINWKIFKANFIQNYEKEMHKNYFDKIENSVIFKQKPKIPETSKKSFEELVELRKSLSDKLELLLREIREKEQLILDLELTVSKLKEENTAIMHKLLTDLEEKEEEEKRLKDVLEEMEAEEENINFAVE